MNSFLKAGAFVLVTVFSASAYSQDSTQAFASCLADSLNGRERKDMAKWIFLSMTVHPTLKEYAKAPVGEREAIDKHVGKLVTRLLTENCPAELRAASQVDPLAIQRGFEFVGQVAMQEIMTNPETAKALTGYAQYVDQAKINALVSGSKFQE